MRRLSRLGLCVGVLWFALPSRSARAEAPLSMEEAIRLAMTNNERAQKAPLRVATAEGQLTRARTAFFPTLVASGTGTLDATADRNGRNLAGAGNLSLSQPIFNLSSFALYAQANHQLESEKWGATEDKRTLAYDTAHGFLLALSSQHLLDAAQQRLERARANQADTAARAEAQLTSTNDVTRTSIDTATAAGQVAQAQGNLEKAYLQLGFLVGRPVSGPLVIPERTSHAAHTGVFDLNRVLHFAEDRRPDLRSAEERTAALEASAREPLYRLAPTLGASGQIRTTVAPVAPDSGHDELALLTLTWTIFDAGARYADRDTRVAQARSQALDEHALRRSVATDIGVAISTLRAARQSYEVAEQAVAAATKNTEETEILYRQGLARAIELTDANGQRYDAEVTLEAAKLNMEQAYLELRQALGLDPIGDDLGSRAASASPPPGAPPPSRPNSGGPP